MGPKAKLYLYSILTYSTVSVTACTAWSDLLFSVWNLSLHCCSTSVKVDCLIDCCAFLLFLMLSCSCHTSSVTGSGENNHIKVQVCTGNVSVWWGWANASTMFDKEKIRPLFSLLHVDFTIRKHSSSITGHTLSVQPVQPPYTCGYIFQEVQKWQRVVCAYRDSHR